MQTLQVTGTATLCGVWRACPNKNSKSNIQLLKYFIDTHTRQHVVLVLQLNHKPNTDEKGDSRRFVHTGWASYGVGDTDGSVLADAAPAEGIARTRSRRRRDDEPGGRKRDPQTPTRH